MKTPLLRAALAELGIKRMLFAIHDASFPSDPDEDIGRGAPTTRAAERLYAYVAKLGFTGLQLGPQGQTSRMNPSPYDGTSFSRHTGAISLASLRAGGSYEGLVPDALLEHVHVADGGHRCQPERAFDASAAIVAAAHAALTSGARPDLAAELTRWREANAPWLTRDAMFAALAATRPDEAASTWPSLDRTLWNPPPRDARRAATRREHLVAKHAPAFSQYALGQFLAHREYARARARCERLGLKLYGDLQIGCSETDAWAYGAAFLADYVMGAPPSRTNPEGQPWGYPVLDPAQYGGAAMQLLVARVDKALHEYDSLRIDHPHGLVCPWVYQSGTPDPLAAVQGGARLFESPDLPDHPGLVRFAIARADQLDRSRPRFADGWVRDLDQAQVTRYAMLLDAIATTAEKYGRDRADISLEVLSTLPLPLAKILERYGLGRWRITQKANLADPSDVYRAELAGPADWVMLGNHDTAPIFGLMANWGPATREAWGHHLVERVQVDPARLDNPGYFATAMLAELFASRAENVSIFYADLFGETERYNIPGTISPDNWTLRLPPTFEQIHAERLARGAALDLPLALALALRARGSTSLLADQLTRA